MKATMKFGVLVTCIFMTILLGLCSHANAQHSPMVWYLENSANVQQRSDGTLYWPADGLEVGLAYHRNWWNGRGGKNVWKDQHPARGVFDFEYFSKDWPKIDRAGIRYLVRLTPGSVQPNRIPTTPPFLPKRFENPDGSGGWPGAPDFMTPSVRTEYRNYLIAARDQFPEGTKFDIAYPGPSGEPRWDLMVNEWQVYTPAQYTEIMRWIEDAHIEVFGAENVVANLDTGPSALARLWNLGVRISRQDGYLSCKPTGEPLWGKERSYEQIRSHPTAGRFFTEGVFIVEIWGENQSVWDTDPNVGKTTDELLILETDRYNASFHGAMGWQVNLGSNGARNLQLVQSMINRMQSYVPSRLATYWDHTTAPPVVGPTKTVTVNQGFISGVFVTQSDIDSGIWRNPGDFPWIGDSVATFPIENLNVVLKPNTTCTGTVSWDVTPSNALASTTAPIDQDEIVVLTGPYEVVATPTCEIDITPPGDLTERVEELEQMVSDLQATTTLQASQIENLNQQNTQLSGDVDTLNTQVQTQRLQFEALNNWLGTGLDSLIEVLQTWRQNQP